MKKDVIKLDTSKAGSIDLADDIFSLEPRIDILHRVVRWQRARAQVPEEYSQRTIPEY